MSETILYNTTFNSGNRTVSCGTVTNMWNFHGNTMENEHEMVFM